jgi:GNAT superfamily N-acetyltransferase
MIEQAKAVPGLPQPMASAGAADLIGAGRPGAHDCVIGQTGRVTVEDYRGRRLGEAMMIWAIEEARRRGCAIVQLTSDKSRHAAHRFYGRLGFVATHEGMKLRL